MPLRRSPTNILSVAPGQDVYFHANSHPIKWVRLAGIVVAIDDFFGRRVYTLDDSSGVNIECVLDVAKPGPNSAADAVKVQPFSATVVMAKTSHKRQTAGAGAAEQAPPITVTVDIGDAIEVRGRISPFRESRQIRIEKIVNLRSTAQEASFWEKEARFRREVLGVRWRLDKKTVRRCRREAMGLGGIKATGSKESAATVEKRDGETRTRTRTKTMANRGSHEDDRHGRSANGTGDASGKDGGQREPTRDMKLYRELIAERLKHIPKGTFSALGL